MLLTWSEDGWVAIATDITKPQTAGGGKGGACKTVYSSNRELPISDVTYINWLNLESIDSAWLGFHWLHQSPLLF